MRSILRGDTALSPVLDEYLLMQGLLYGVLFVAGLAACVVVVRTLQPYRIVSLTIFSLGILLATWGAVVLLQILLTPRGYLLDRFFP